MLAKRKVAHGAKRKIAEALGSEKQKKKKRVLASLEQPAISAPSVPKSNDDIVKAAFMNKTLISASNFTGSDKSAVIYVGRIPHGFYEDQMRGFFSQFGDIKRLRLSRNKKTGKSKHYAFIEFESPEVAPIVAEAMHNYLLFESMLQVKIVPVDEIKPSLWVGANKPFRTIKWQRLERERHNRVRTPKEQSQHLGLLVKKDQKRKKKLKNAGIDYDYPELKAIIPPSSKKSTFHDNDDL